jgi:CHAT domain-containing protein/Tfp pilus assembly protein PilF
MLNKIIIFTCFSILYTISSFAQPGARDSLWERLTYINNVKSFSAHELEFLLNTESVNKQLSSRPDSTYAFLLMGIGHLYFEQGNYSKAAQYYRRAIDIVSSNSGKPWMNSDNLVVGYYRLNVVYDSLNRVSDEMKAIDSCITIARRRKIVDLFCLAAIYKKVEYLFDVGDYNNCISYATLCEMLGRQFAYSRGKKEYDYGMQYASKSLLWNVLAEITMKNYDVAEKLLNDKLEECKRTGNSSDLGTIYEQSAEVQMDKGKPQKALAYYNTALAIESKAGHDISCKGIVNNIGYLIYFKNFGDYERALYYFRKALTYSNKDKDEDELNAVETLNVLTNIGDVYAREGRYDSAFAYFRLALDQIKPGISETELLNSQFDVFARQKKIEYITTLLLDKGDALQQLYKIKGNGNAIKEAVRIYKLADQFFDRIRTEQSDPQSKLFWRSDSRRLYEHAIEACYDEHNAEDAFYFFEKSRAALLNDQLNEQRWLGEADIQKRTQVSRNIIKLNRATENMDRSSESYKEMENELFSNRQELERLAQAIKERDPLYYQSFIDTGVTTIREVQKKILSDHRALVEIFSGDSAVYVITVLAAGTDFKKLDKDVFDSISRAYISFVSNVSMLNGKFPEFAALSRQLYQLIFPNKKLPAGRIVISPDGQYFPFEALITNHTGQPVNYFLNDYIVSYTYSAKYLMNHFVDYTSNTSHVFLGIAPVRYPASMRLASLQGSDNSLSLVETGFNGAHNLVFADATRAGFMNRFSKYKIIQLYTHASDSGKNGEPVIYFADSSLNLSELLGEDKPATRLVVLSACETGKGRYYKGEGIFSFNRGFAALGIPSSITNLWSVDNRSTYRLTELFYKYLAKNMPVDMALQQAKIEFLKTGSKENQLPYFWAASVLIGKSNSLDLDRSLPWKEMAWLILALILIYLLIRFKRNNKVNFYSS